MNEYTFELIVKYFIEEIKEYKFNYVFYRNRTHDLKDIIDKIKVLLNDSTKTDIEILEEIESIIKGDK